VRALPCIAVVVLLCGCGSPVVNQPLLTECFTEAAYAAIAAQRVVEPPAPQKCCGKCTNGKVRSGDGIAWVDCPCPASCGCKPKGVRR
jgi:hypothetical protein